LRARHPSPCRSLCQNPLVARGHLGCYFGNNVIQPAFRYPSEQPISARKVRNPSHHVVESWTICLLVWDENNFRCRCGQVLDFLRQRKNGYLFLGPNIDDLPCRTGRLQKTSERANYVVNRTETAALAGGAVYSHGLSGERLF